MPDPLATATDITATPASVPPAAEIDPDDPPVSLPEGAASGGWSITAPLQVQIQDHLTSEGQPVAFEARASFLFKGLNAGGSDFTLGPLELVLSPEPTLVTGRGGDLLHDGDSVSDRYGNTIAAGSDRALRSD